MRLAGKVAVIAAGSLGVTIAREFLKEGCQGLVLADLKGNSLDGVARDLKAGEKVIAVVIDVSNPDDVGALIDAAIDQYGHLDVTVNNAGVLSGNARIQNVDRADMDPCIRGKRHEISQRNRGSTSSDAHSGGRHHYQHRLRCRHNSMDLFGPILRLQSRDYSTNQGDSCGVCGERIRANCVCPGSFESAMFAEVPPKAVQVIAARHPLGIGLPESLVGAFAYLASDEARWTTGAAIVVDGGLQPSVNPDVRG